MEKIKDNLPEISESLSATLNLNVKTTEEQRVNPDWQKEVQLMHDGFAQITKRRPYYRTADKFNIMTTRYPGMLSVGSTKDSVMKFWIGAGVLMSKDDSFRQLVMSPRQLEHTDSSWHDIHIIGLDGKNFSRVRITK